MIPTIHKPRDIDFDGGGIGFINDAYSLISTEEKNGQFETKLIVPSTTKYVEHIENGYQIKVKANDEDEYQVFTIYRHFKDTATGQVIAYAKNRTFKHRWRTVKKAEIISKTAIEAMAIIENQMDQPSDVELFSDITTVSSTLLEATNSLACIAGQRGSLLNYWGGEIKHDPFKLSLLKRRGRDNVTTISYQKNLDGLKADFDFDGVLTKILPYADIQNTEGQTERIYGAYVESDLITNYPEVYSDSIQFTEEQGVTDLESLNRVSKKYFTSLNPGVDKPKINLVVDILKLDVNEKTSRFKDFNKLNLCDTFTVYHPEFNVDITAEVIKMDYDGLNEKVIGLTAGDPKFTFFESQQYDLQEVVKSLSSKDYTSTFIDYVTKIISGNDGGTVVWWPKNRPTDLFFIDNDDLQTAKQVLRINKSGIGFSSNGWQGPFDTAWTLNGIFNAKFIKTGIIQADVFQGSFNDVGDALKLVAGALQVWNDEKVIMELNRNGLDFWDELTKHLGRMGTAGKQALESVADYGKDYTGNALFIDLDKAEFIQIANQAGQGFQVYKNGIMSSEVKDDPTGWYHKGNFSVDGIIRANKLFIGGQEVTPGGTGGGGWNGQYPPEITTQAEKFAWQLWMTLLPLGYSKASIAGILGNIQGEVGPSMNPDTAQSGGAGPGYGAVQWDGSAYPLVGSPTWNGREYVQRLMVAASIKESYVTMIAQGKLIDWCMFNGQWLGAVSPTTVAGFKAETSAANAALAFELNFERPAAAHPERQGWAIEWYNKFVNLVPPTGTGEFIKPLDEPVIVTSEFGWRESPTGGGQELHNAIDLVNNNDYGPIFASNSGTVVFSAPGWNGGYGEYIIIQHKPNLFTGYAHNAQRFVNVGDTVSKGQRIATIGETGNVTGIHTHFQFMEGTDMWSGHVNPRNYINF